MPESPDTGGAWDKPYPKALWDAFMRDLDEESRGYAADMLRAMGGGKGRTAVKFNPDQPRAPEGTSIGGEWVPAGGGEAYGALDRAPVAASTSPEGKKWARENQALYENDPEFKRLADALAAYTQGGYGNLREASARDARGDKSDRLPGGRDYGLDASIGSLTSPMGKYSNYFKGQDIEHSAVTARQGGEAINRAIRAASPRPESIYRGMTFRGEIDADPRTDKTMAGVLGRMKVGDTFEIHGASSFTTDREIARDFANGKTPGKRAPSRPPPMSVLFEIRPGAKAVVAAPLSPWKQMEVITSGKFRVVQIEGDRFYRVALQQEAVW